MNKQIDEINDPIEYQKLSEARKKTLKNWITDCVSPYQTKTFASPTSYYLKHLFTEATGIYLTNGQMKGGLLAAGFEPKDAYALNWVFRVSKKAGTANKPKM